MAAGHIGVSFELRESACIVKVHGELTWVTGHEFTARLTQPLAVFRGPVLFDLSGLDFVDCHGARVLAGALHSVASRETGLFGCNPAVRRFLDLLGLDLPHVATLAREVPVPPPPPVLAGPLSRGQDLTALIRATEASARQSATRASDIMSRLATTCADLALNSRYRTPRNSEVRGRLLTLSGRARDLSQQYLRTGSAPSGDVLTGPPAYRASGLPGPSG